MSDALSYVAAAPTRIVQGWGRVLQSPTRVVSVRSVDHLRRELSGAVQNGLTMIGRGTGFSYGDPALNRDNIVLDMTPMNRILAWSPDSGVVEVEPGVTVGDLCRHVAPHGWWPPVLPGTQGPTLGGCVAANVHGKNNWKAGPIGEHVVEMDLMLADGSTVTCGPEVRSELFQSAVGGFGLLGVITRLRLQLEPSSRVLLVDGFSCADLTEMLGVFDRWAPAAHYMVGWVDGCATGKDVGRGLVRIAHLLPPSDDPPVPDRSIVPAAVRSRLWMAMKPMTSRAVVRPFNSARYLTGFLWNGSGSLMSRTRFDFFHDAVPQWNRAFSGGVIQYQVFVPRDQSACVFKQVLEGAPNAGQQPILVVIKRHRRDGFTLSEGVDGFSLSMDFAVSSSSRRKGLEALLGKLTESVVLPAGGRFYLAKDSLLTADQARQSLGDAAVETFLEQKRLVDPGGSFQSDLYRRLLARANNQTLRTKVDAYTYNDS